MKGKYRIVVQNKRLRYDFEIKRNITIIRGDSATGKTALIEMVREFQENENDSGIELECEKRCIAIFGSNWEIQLRTIHDSIVFIDEGARFTASREFAAFIQKTDNYYVIVSRESLPSLPYSVEEIYGIRNSGKYGSLKRTYNEIYRLYGEYDFSFPIVPEQILTEDSNAGFAFFQDVCKTNGITCISAHGKSNIFSNALKLTKGETLIIADGAAFGSEIEKILKLLGLNSKLHLYLPESFEWLILKSGLFEDGEIKKILKEPYQYIESSQDFSWERFFTKLLTRITANTYMEYTKRNLNPFYIQKNVKTKILQVMEKIEL